MAATAERVVRVSTSTANFIAGGGRDPEFHALDVPAGTHVRLQDDRGEDVGLAIADPENGKLRVFAVAADGFAKIDAALLGWRVERALAWRRQLGLVGEHHAYRLIHGGGDSLPGFTCDVLGRAAVVYVYAEAMRGLGAQLAEAIVGFAKLDGAVVKVRRRGGASEVEQDVVGRVPEHLVVTEHDVPYEIHPLAGLNVGLFTDMREHRLGLRRYVAGRRVLNLFSYTGAHSVVSARAGAASVTSVDTSAGVQAWAQGNFGRSNLDPKDPRWRFETGDAARFLERAARDKERYDVVLIDPPSASTAGKSWAIGRDYPELIARAAAVIARDGVLWLASNAYELGSIAKLGQKGVRAAGRGAALLELGSLPPEYPIPISQPHDRYLQVCALRVD